MDYISSSIYRIVSGIYAVIFIMIICSCAPFPHIRSQEPLQNRVEDTVLLIGCVIVEPFVCSICGPYTVVVAYQPINPKSDRLETIWIKTDSSGYYALANIPEGRYSLAGVYIDDKGLFWYDPLEGKGPRDIFSPDFIRPREGNEPWVRSLLILGEDQAPFPEPRKPPTWPEPLEGNIYDFGYLVLTDEMKIDETSIAREVINSYHYDSLNGEKFVLGKEYYLPPVPEYFIEKYPNSEWIHFLKRIIR